MKILRDGDCDFYSMRVADMAVGGDHDRAGRRSLGNARDQKRIGADHYAAFQVAKLDARTLPLLRPQARTGDPDLPSRQRQHRRDGFNVRSAVHALLAQDAVGKSHEENTRTTSDDLTTLEDQSAIRDAQLQTHRDRRRYRRA